MNGLRRLIDVIEDPKVADPKLPDRLDVLPCRHEAVERLPIPRSNEGIVGELLVHRVLYDASIEGAKLIEVLFGSLLDDDLEHPAINMAIFVAASSED